MNSVGVTCSSQQLPTTMLEFMGEVFQIFLWKGWSFMKRESIPTKKPLHEAARLRQLEYYANSWYRKVQELADESATRAGMLDGRYQDVVSTEKPKAKKIGTCESHLFQDNFTKELLLIPWLTPRP